ncbi:uncharacterized protein LOC127027143 [Gymnogyps californianus]|uniref:uncharacterized protein LOC127027143 n=1 Tax=Gymnogyps californianus TaxID=33616 RepID=UPI0021C898C5|nr:uncharacterized protein LOC127027143 [Gymnogyps californianus]
MPCLHQFCYPCILRWAENKPECPLCKREVTSILHSVQGDDNFEEHVIPPPAAPLVFIDLTEGAPGHPATHNLHRLAASWPSAARLVPGAPVGRLRPHVWAFLFRQYPAMLQPLLPWLRQELGLILEDVHEAAAAAVQRFILSSLQLFGLDEEALFQLLQNILGVHARIFVCRMIDTIKERCSEEAQRRIGVRDARAAEEQEGTLTAAPSPAASQGGSPAPSPALRGGPSSAPSAPVPAHGEQEEPQEDAAEAVPGPSTPSQGSQLSPGGPRRAPKRRASSPEDPSQPPRKPLRH